VLIGSEYDKNDIFASFLVLKLQKYRFQTENGDSEKSGLKVGYKCTFGPEIRD